MDNQPNTPQPDLGNTTSPIGEIPESGSSTPLPSTLPVSEKKPEETLPPSSNGNGGPPTLESLAAQLPDENNADANPAPTAMPSPMSSPTTPAATTSFSSENMKTQAAGQATSQAAPIEPSTDQKYGQSANQPLPPPSSASDSIPEVKQMPIPPSPTEGPPSQAAVLTNSEQAPPANLKQELPPATPAQDEPLPSMFKPVEEEVAAPRPAPAPPAVVPIPSAEYQPPAAPRVPLPPRGIGSTAIIRRPMGRFGLAIVIFILSLALLGGIFYLFFYRATIIITPTPTPDKITLDNKQVQPGKFKVIPGPHSIEVSKSGYISLNINENLKIDQKVDLGALKLQADLQPEMVTQGASRVDLSEDQKIINFVSGEGTIEAMTVQKQDSKYNIAPLSNGSYQNIRELVYSSDNKFVFVLDKDFLRIVDFSRPDLIDQQEVKLPPAASNIHSFSTNAVSGQFFGDANSQIVYDLKTDNDWFLILADRNHKSSQILMQIDPTQFSQQGLFLDWGQNPRAILVAGDTAGIFDLPTRVFSKISDEKGFDFCQWGLTAKYGLCTKSDGQLYKLQDGKLTNFNLKVDGTKTSWISPSEVFVVVEGRPIKINFDTGQTINYAEIAGLQNSSFIAVSANTIFFTDKEGLKAGNLKTDVYTLPK